MFTQPAQQQLLKIFTFSAGAETFGLPLHLLHEVIYPETITRIPTAPDFMAGVVKYGAEPVPVLDVSKKLYLATPSMRIHHPAVVVNVVVEGKETQLALLVERFGKIVQYRPAETVKRKNIPFRPSAAPSAARVGHPGRNSEVYTQSREAIRKFVHEELYRAGVRIRLLDDSLLFSLDELR
ncbi:MAG: chemotaxis protein CheW [Desulfovibrionales bacterium]|nr:chemotaxis protein CheW [Desulfovibrionales bacterium]